MADAPDHRAAYATTPTATTAALQLDAVAVGAESANVTNMGIIATPTNAASDSSTTAAAIEDSLAAATDSTPANNIALALKPNAATRPSPRTTPTSQDPHTSSEEDAVASASSNPSLFAKLPGELRNRIYRAYFEDSARQRKHTMDIRKAASTFLNLFHTDRMIRAEASSIFFKEFLAVDSFFVPAELEVAIKSRIKSICALVAIRDMSLTLSITVQESVVGEALYLSNTRSDFVGKLMRFITNETNEWFARNTDSEKPAGEEGTQSPSNQTVRSESMVHTSRHYRVERLHPDTGLARWTNPNINMTPDEYVRGHQLGLQGAYQPIREGADFLRVAGPLTGLDWSKFEWSAVGAYNRGRRTQANRFVAR